MIETSQLITIPCIKITQPIGDFFIGAIDAKDLFDISYAEIRRPDGRDIEKHIGTQRDLNPGRVAEIKQYVKNVDACFPTSIILAIDDTNVTFEPSEIPRVGALAIRRDSEVAKIIDGQHRIAGLEGYVGPPFQLNVTIFVDMDLEDQAMVFATINLKQTKVSKSLAYDLYEYAEARSPQKTAHNIAKLMNFREGSPLRHFIKILGKATGSEFESITQAAFVDRLLKLITTNAMFDKDQLKRGRQVPRADRKEQQRLIFRNAFIEDEDAKIAKVLWEYFSAVADLWETAWYDRSKGAILGRTTGFAALIRLLPEVFRRVSSGPLEDSKNLPETGHFAAVLRHIKLKDDVFNSSVYVPGSSGESKLFEDLLSPIRGLPTLW